MFVRNKVIRDTIVKSGKYILGMYILPFLWVGLTSITTTSKTSLIEIPKLELNFYMMGRDSIDEELILSIGRNVEYLNQEFEGTVLFELNELVMDANGAYLPTLHENYFYDEASMLNELTRPVEIEGGINIYLFDTYLEEGTDQALMGFTPILTGKHKMYANQSPRFDRILIAYPGLESKSTLVHEMGHFLGLQHPWEMHNIDLTFMGLNTRHKIEHNHMAYGPEVDSFTEEQLERMQDFAIRFRDYLVLPSAKFYSVASAQNQ